MKFSFGTLRMKDNLQQCSRHCTRADFRQKGAGFRDDVVRIPGKMEWEHPCEMSHADMTVVQ